MDQQLSGDNPEKEEEEKEVIKQPQEEQMVDQAAEAIKRQAMGGKPETWCVDGIEDDSQDDFNEPRKSSTVNNESEAREPQLPEQNAPHMQVAIVSKNQSPLIQREDEAAQEVEAQMSPVSDV